MGLYIKFITFFTISILTIPSVIQSAVKPAITTVEKLIADIPFRSYRNITSSDTKEIIRKIQASTITMSRYSWEDLILRGRTRFEKNRDWHELVKAVFEHLDKDDLQSKREFLNTLEKLEKENSDASNELRDFLRNAKLIDIVK